MESIFTRRSIRKYTDKDINDEKLKSLLKAGMAAPSARNEQPWHFIVIREREKLNKITSIHPYSGMLKGAPLAILVCGDKRVLPDNAEEDFGYLIVDCSAATQNILLQAESEGLGAVWLGIYPRKERMDGLKELFSLPEHIVPVSLISVGYPAEKKPVNDRYLEERIHYNSF
ncbi:MAG: nitroreductase family protein [bacterium]